MQLLSSAPSTDPVKKFLSKSIELLFQRYPPLSLKVTSQPRHIDYTRAVSYTHLFDTLAAEAVLALREEFSHVSLLLLLPCRDQAARWRPEEVRRYERIKREADAVEYLGERYAPGCMQRRNRALVDWSAHCICYLTQNSGGTKYTVDYAKRRGLSITNLAEQKAQHL